MNAEKYWSQDTVYFFATCALSPDNLSGVIFTAEQMNDYIMYIEEHQANTLVEYQNEGMLKVQVLGDPEDGRQFVITDINQESFRQKLVDYLEKYREGELLPGLSSYDDSYENTKELLYAYLRKSARELPVVNPRNLWASWTGERPFWETVLVADLLDGDVSVQNMAIVHDATLYGASLPRVVLGVIKPLGSQPPAARRNGRRFAQIVIERTSSRSFSAFIDVEGERRHLVSNSMKTDMGPHSLLQYLIDHPGEDVVRDYAARRIQNCNVQNLSDVIRQVGFDENLKNLFFEVSTKNKVQLKKEVYLTDNEVLSLPN